MAVGVTPSDLAPRLRTLRLRTLRLRMATTRTLAHANVGLRSCSIPHLLRGVTYVAPTLRRPGASSSILHVTHSPETAHQLALGIASHARVHPPFLELPFAE